jgi:hypothetical protein
MEQPEFAEVDHGPATGCTLDLELVGVVVGDEVPARAALAVGSTK